MTNTTKEDKLLTKIENIILDNSLRTADAHRMAIELIKQYGTEQRVDENNMYIRELTRHYFPSGPSEPHIPLVQSHERTAELTALKEQEKK